MTRHRFPERLDCRVPAGWRDRVEAIAAEQGQSPAEWLRSLIHGALESADRIAYPVAKRLTAVCSLCGATFTPRRPTDQYCSTRCREHVEASQAPDPEDVGLAPVECRQCGEEFLANLGEVRCGRCRDADPPS